MSRPTICKEWATSNYRNRRRRRKFKPDSDYIKKSIAEFKKKGGKITKMPYLETDNDPRFCGQKYDALNIFEWE